MSKTKNAVIGFGITEKTISSFKKADGLVVGSALCKGISDSLKKRQNPVIKLNKMVKVLKNKIFFLFLMIYELQMKISRSGV